MTIENRTSSVGLYNYAHSYASSAEALSKLELRITHPSSPVYFLYYHSIELYLKSYLVACGVSTDELKKMGHRTRKLAEAVKSFGLNLRDEDEAIIDFMSETDAVIESRYIVTGYKGSVPDFQPILDTCRYLHDQIGPKAYEGSGVSRRPTFK